MAAVNHRQRPRSICRGRKPLPVIVAYFDPLLESLETKYTPAVVTTRSATPYADARPTWLG